MLKRNIVFLTTTHTWLAIVVLLSMPMACSQGTKPPVQRKGGVKRIGAGQEFSGFLKDYSALKPNPNLDGDALTYVNADERKNLRSYFAIVVDPVEAYISTDADESKIPDTSRGA